MAIAGSCARFCPTCGMHPYADGTDSKGNKVARFAAPPGYALDLRALPYAAHRLELLACEEFDVEVDLDAAGYADYLLGDAGVEAAIDAGLPVDDALRWIEQAFAALFDGQRRAVAFEVQLGVAHKPVPGG